MKKINRKIFFISLVILTIFFICFMNNKNELKTMDIHKNNYYTSDNGNELAKGVNGTVNWEKLQTSLTDKRTITGYKVWEGGKTKEPVTLTLSKKVLKQIDNSTEENVEDNTKENETVEELELVEEKVANKENNFTIEFIVDKTDEDGKTIEYVLDEKEEFKNYEKDVNGFIVTNRYVVPLGTITGRIRIPEQGPLSNLEVDLIRTDINGTQIKPVETKYITKEELEELRQNKQNIYKAIYKGMPATDNNGEKYTYQISVKATSSNFVLTHEKGEIIFKYISPKTKEFFEINYPVNSYDDKQPEIKVNIVRRVVGTKDKYELVKQMPVKPGDKSLIISDIDLTDELGNKYEYIMELPKSEKDKKYGYIPSIEDEKLVVRYFSKKIDITSEVIWQGLTGPSPEVKLQLYRNNVKFGKPVVLKSGENKYTFKNLDETDGYGRKYTYKIDQINNVPGFTKTLKEDKYQIINTKEVAKGQVLPFAGQYQQEAGFGILLGLIGLLVFTGMKFKKTNKRVDIKKYNFM